MVLDRTNRRRDRRGRIAGGNTLIDMAMRVEPGQELQADFDIRKLVRRVQLALAIHFSESVLDGVRPDTGRPLPKLSPATKNRRGPRVGGFGVRTGKTVKSWMVGKVGGNPLRAKGKVFPSNDPEFRRLASLWLSRPDPVDLQAVDGNAEDVIKAAFDEWVDAAFGAGVSTESRPDTAQTSIDKVK